MDRESYISESFLAMESKASPSHIYTATPALFTIIYFYVLQMTIIPVPHLLMMRSIRLCCVGTIQKIVRFCSQNSLN